MKSLWTILTFVVWFAIGAAAYRTDPNYGYLYWLSGIVMLIGMSVVADDSDMIWVVSRRNSPILVFAGALIGVIALGYEAIPAIVNWLVELWNSIDIEINEDNLGTPEDINKMVAFAVCIIIAAFAIWFSRRNNRVAP